VPTNPIEEARNAARAVVAEYGVPAAPVPIERIARSKNIIVQYAPLDGELSGMAYIKDGIGVIGVNALHHPNRQRFSIAHELGHHILHRSLIETEVHVDKEFRVLQRGPVASQGVDPVEMEANAFASEVLMPEPLLVQAVGERGIDLEDDSQIEALARKFRVSTAVVRYRLGRYI
jgi:Zn-dependent peptidase ImmA (M78 family)